MFIIERGRSASSLKVRCGDENRTFMMLLHIQRGCWIDVEECQFPFKIPDIVGKPNYFYLIRREGIFHKLSLKIPKIWQPNFPESNTKTDSSDAMRIGIISSFCAIPKLPLETPWAARRIQQEEGENMFRWSLIRQALGAFSLARATMKGKKRREQQQIESTWVCKRHDTQHKSITTPSEKKEKKNIPNIPHRDELWKSNFETPVLPDSQRFAPRRQYATNCHRKSSGHLQICGLDQMEISFRFIDRPLRKPRRSRHWTVIITCLYLPCLFDCTSSFRIRTHRRAIERMTQTRNVRHSKMCSWSHN